MAVAIQLRGGTAAQWTSADPILAERELCVETDTGKFKVGDGVKKWSLLPYFTQGTQGIQGQKGDAATISVGTTTTGAAGTSASVTNSGTTSAAVFNFVIPQGIKGDTGSVEAATKIHFDTSYSGGTPNQGDMAWDSDALTAAIKLNSDVTLQIGQEHLIQVRNDSGSAIPDFTLVMFSGVATQGDWVRVVPAVTNGTYDVAMIVGITTQPIAAGAKGFVTQLGFVNGVNTSSYSSGSLLYGDPATPGGFVTTKPSSPAWQIPVGAVTRSHATNGRVLVRAIPGGGGGGSDLIVNESVPSSPQDKQRWLNSANGKEYIRYTDSDSAQWIETRKPLADDSNITGRLVSLEAAPAGLVRVVPTSVTVGSGTASVSSTGVVTFTGASSVSLNGVFSAIHPSQSYHMAGQLVASSEIGDIRMRLRASGADRKSGLFASILYQIFTNWGDAPTISQESIANLDYVWLGLRRYTSFDVRLKNPAIATETELFVNSGYDGSNKGLFTAMGRRTSAVEDGLSIMSNTGVTISGWVKISVEG